MNYLLDTNACISYLNDPQSPVRYHLDRLEPTSVFVCSIVKAADLWSLTQRRKDAKLFSL